MTTDSDQPEIRSRATSFFIWLVAVALIAASAFFYLRSAREGDDAVVQTESGHAPLIRHPVPDPEPAAGPGGQASPLTAHLPVSLPDLDDSDPVLMKVAEYLITNPSLAALVVPRDVIRRLVIAIDNMTGRAIPLNHLPVTPPGEKFLVAKIGEQTVIDQRNAARYRRYVMLMDSLDSRDVANAYIHFYPLFQQAYRELGYPQGFFNDRLIATIDNLLETPEIRDPLRLEQPLVFYVYADSKLEALSAGQRLLLRMGSDNADAIKRKLREIRQELVRQ